MRRLIVLVAVTVLALASLSAVVQAGSGRAPADRDARPPLQELVVPEIAPAAAVPPYACNPNDPVERYLNCLNKYLNRLAKNLNTTISKLQQTQADLYGLYACIQAVPVSWYMGYWYGNLSSGFETTALDYTVDPSMEEFEYFGVIDPTCVVPAS